MRKTINGNDVSIEISESRTYKVASNESISPLLVHLNTKNTESQIPMRKIIHLGADNISDRDGAIPGSSTDPTQVPAKTPVQFTRFDKQIQTSKEKVNPMQDLGSFMNNLLVNIKQSKFNVRQDDADSVLRPAGPSHNPPQLSAINTNPVTNLFTQNRVDVRIFEPAKNNWKTLRNLPGKKVQLELRIVFNQKLLETDHFPGWAVNFKPPMHLLNMERAVEATVSFRYEHAKQSIQMLNDLMEEESARLSNEIQATMVSLECHYKEQAASAYNIEDTIGALRIFMQRTKDTEESELTKRYNAIHEAPLAALWTNLPASVHPPPGATRPIAPQSTPEPRNTTQGFHGSGRGTRRPSWRGGRGHSSQGMRGTYRGGVSQRGRYNNQTIQAMKTLFNGMMNQ